MTRRAVVMDRDGTICVETGRPTGPEQLRLIEGSARAVRLANEAGFQTVVATNQSAVARGFLDEARLAEAHDRLRALLAEQGARLDGIYHCPHHPSEGRAPYRRECECRKPRPGMLLRAQDEMGIDPARSYVIGDRMRDLEPGRALGATTILVRTGYGCAEQEAAVRPEEPTRMLPDHVADDLLAAVSWILDRETSTAEAETPAARSAP